MHKHYTTTHAFIVYATHAVIMYATHTVIMYAIEVMYTIASACSNLK